MSFVVKTLARLGLEFANAEDEGSFVDLYARNSMMFSRIMLLIGGLFYYLFFIWDYLIDPKNSLTTQMIRGLFVYPIVIAAVIVLFSNWGKRYAEYIMILLLMTGHLGLLWVYSILNDGFKYAAVAILLQFIGISSAFPVRSKVLLVGSAFVLISTIVGHVLADNAPPGWLIVNIMLVVCGITAGTLATFIREQSARQQFLTSKELEGARTRVDELLQSILPDDIAQRIQAGETSIADSKPEVSIIFADLVGFTDLSRRLSPLDLIKMLNRIFSAFDREAVRFGIDRIKTIGDAYMAIGGLNQAVGRDHAEDAADFALALQTSIKEIYDETGLTLAARVGLHVGPVVAGVIGHRRPAFDCWGEAVNLASRLEANAPAGSILISESAHWRLRERFDVTPVDDIELKGIGQTRAFILNKRLVERTALKLQG